MFVGSTPSIALKKQQPEEIQIIKVELAQVKDQLASLVSKSSKQEWVIDSLNNEIAELKKAKSQLKEMATEIQILKNLHLKK